MRRMLGPFSAITYTASAVSANSYTSGRFITRGNPCGVPQVLIGSGKTPCLISSMFFLYFASHSSLYGGDSRTPASPARPLAGWTVDRSNTVPPCIDQTPLQSGNEDCGGCVACAVTNVTPAEKTAAAATAVRTARRVMSTLPAMTNGRARYTAGRAGSKEYAFAALTRSLKAAALPHFTRGRCVALVCPGFMRDHRNLT